MVNAPQLHLQKVKYARGKFLLKDLLGVNIVIALFVE